MSQAYSDNVPTLRSNGLYKRSGPIPEQRLSALLERHISTIVVRSPDASTSSDSSATTSCGPKDTSGACERMVGTTGNTTLPIVLGVVIPLTVAFVTLIFLHRRHVKKLRREDAEDAQKSLDFGMDGSEKRKRKKGGTKLPEMSVSEARGAVRGDRGVSMDLGVTNPYLLPPELKESRESLHSLSRTMNTGDDKYRATNFIPDDGSIRSPSSLRSGWDDNSSTYTGTSKKRVDTESTKGLLPQPSINLNEPVPTIRKPSPVAKDGGLLAPSTQDHSRDSYVSTTSSNGAVAALRASNNYLGAFISGGGATKKEKPVDKEGPMTSVVELEGSSPISKPLAVATPIQSPKRQSVAADPPLRFDFNIQADTPELASHETVTYHELATERNSTVPRLSIIHPQPAPIETRISSPDNSNRISDSQVDISHDSVIINHIGPEEAEPTTQHEQQHLRAPSDLRAGSISGQESDYYEDEEAYDIDDYREVLGYDPHLLNMGQRPLPPDDPSENPEERALRIRSFYKEYFDDSAPKPGNGRVSYYDGSENYVDDYYGTYNSSPYASRGPSRAGPPQTRHRVTISNGTYGGYQGPRNRAYSAASSHLGPRRPPQPRRKMPPPAPLNVLPTPHKLQDDSMLPNAIDFAPPQVFKNQRAGTPDSLKGGQRPFSPSTKAYNPLVSSFDDLAVLPSPHQLRKSGTFTSLDFAPPRFAVVEGTGSETGSIRSNRSGVSALHQHNIRTGAYRVSRIPKEVAGTKNEMSNVLRPQWDMNR